MKKNKRTKERCWIRKAALFLTLILTLFSGQSAFAQGTRGAIRGTITDPNGAVVPNASVQLIDVQKGTTVRTTTTNENGEYQFIEIEPSTYRIAVTAPSFAELRLTDFTVEPNRNLVLDAVVSVTAGTNEVEVTAGAEQIDRETPTLGTTVENRRIEGLPLNGRNVLNLVLLQPGVTATVNTGGVGAGTGFRVNGSRSVENNVTLDGANNNEVAVGGIIGGVTRPDAVQEFRLLTSNFEAEFGRNTGSIVNVVTKSGTNEFHGNARFFYRPTFLSAANFFDNLKGGEDNRQPFERKEYGFNIGGPVYFLNFGEGVPVLYSGKDKTFFFVDYERRNQKVGGTATVTGIPTAAERGGDFSGLLAQGRILYDPLTATADNPGGNPFPNNRIPTSRFSPIALYYLQFFPETDATGRGVINDDTVSTVNYFTGRFDHNFNRNHLLSFTYNYNDTNTASGIPFGGSQILGFGDADISKSENYVGRYTAVITPNLVNNLLIGYAKNDYPSGAPVNTATPAQIGFTANFVANGSFAGPPLIQFFDRDFQIGNSIQGPQARVAENIQFQNSLSWVVGNHRLKFGGDYVKYKQEQDFLFVNNGAFIYSADFGVGGNTVGDDFADFLIGNTPIAAQYGSNGQRDFRQTAFAGFVQDNWRATKNLTLSLGVRYEYVSPLTDTENRVAYYRALPGVTSQLLTSGALTSEGSRIVVPPGGRAPNGLVYVGDPDPVLGGTVPAGGVRLDKNNFAPRIGFAYSLSGGDGFFGRLLGNNQTVIRGGYGWYYGAVIADTIGQQLTAPGYQGTNAFYFPANGTLSNPFGPDPFPLYRYLGGGAEDELLGGPNPNPFLSTADIFVTAPLSQNSRPTDPFLETPVVQQYSLTIERSFARDYVLGLSYVGNRGRKLYVEEQINPALGTLLPASLRIQGGAIPTPSTGNVNTRRVNNDIPLSIDQLTTKGRSKYDSFQANFQKRFSGDGLSFQFAYTFSKSFNDADTQTGNVDVLDPDAGWGLSADDRPHRFVGSFIYELPFFKDYEGFGKRLLDGWSIGGIYTFQSGSVFSVGNPIDTTGAGGAVITFADLGVPFRLLDPKTNNLRAFNIDAFAIADCRVLNANGTPVSGRNYDLCINADGTKGRRGTSGRNQFRLNNTTNNVDAIVAKKTRLWGETANLELRFEAFNLFNRTQFVGIDLNFTTGTPGSTLTGNPNFGTYTSAGQGRVIQLGARLNF